MNDALAAFADATALQPDTRDAAIEKALLYARNAVLDLQDAAYIRGSDPLTFSEADDLHDAAAKAVRDLQSALAALATKGQAL